MLSVIARLFEKLIHEQLFSYFNDYLHKKQADFRPKYSTQTALLDTSNQWLPIIDKGDYNLAVFLDLRKAFDTVNHNLLLKKLLASCKYMIIGLKFNLSHINHIPNINILGHNIERVDQIEQLSVTTDDQLKWNKHVDKLCKKLSSAFNGAS